MKAVPRRMTWKRSSSAKWRSKQPLLKRYQNQLNSLQRRNFNNRAFRKTISQKGVFRRKWPIESWLIPTNKSVLSSCQAPLSFERASNFVFYLFLLQRSNNTQVAIIAIFVLSSSPTGEPEAVLLRLAGGDVRRC